MKSFLKSEPARVIVLSGNPLTEAEIVAAFKGNQNTQWYKAIVQIVSEDRHNEAFNCAAYAEANNALAMASAFGAYKNASGLLNTLATYVEAET